MHWAVMVGLAAVTIAPSTTWPQILRGSCSLFSSSPLMYGMTLSTISGHDAKVLPAPEIAWYVHTAMRLGPKALSGWIAGT
jgi:hypothetical protein